MGHFRLKKFPKQISVRRLWAAFRSEKTYNLMAYSVFYFGYVTQMYPIERPILQNLGQYGQVVLLQYRNNPYQKVVRGLGAVGYGFWGCFEVLQMIRFVPTEGLTLRVVYIVYYFALTTLCTLGLYLNFKNDKMMVYGWNCIEANTKLCQRLGIREAAKWKYSPVALLIMLSISIGSIILAISFILLCALKPNLAAHLFYLLPEKWKQNAAAYWAMLLWEAFCIFDALTAMNFMVVIAVGFVFGTQVVAIEAAASSLAIADKIRIFRSIEMLNQMANEYGRDLFVPFVSFCTVATGAMFTYIALTRFGDPQLGLLVYSGVVMFDVMILMAVTIVFIQAGKYSDASAGLIESIKMAFKEGKALEEHDTLQLQISLKQLAGLRPFELKVGSYAVANVETTKLMHETIIDYLLLLLSY